MSILLLCSSLRASCQVSEIWSTSILWLSSLSTRSLNLGKIDLALAERFLDTESIGHHTDQPRQRRMVLIHMKCLKMIPERHSHQVGEYRGRILQWRYSCSWLYCLWNALNYDMHDHAWNVLPGYSWSGPGFHNDHNVGMSSLHEYIEYASCQLKSSLCFYRNHISLA